ncbi:MAG: hypothetical protein JWO62_1157 [Acidimicrobiaceae bacterium]|nr:hypothetical protein [Acidimicrobiaceae bacterium]
MLLSSVSAADIGGFAALGGFLIVLGGVIERQVTSGIRRRRRSKLGVHKTEAAVWGSKATEFDPEQPGLIQIVADLAARVDRESKEADRLRKENQRLYEEHLRELDDRFVGHLVNLHHADAPK